MTETERLIAAWQTARTMRGFDDCIRGEPRKIGDALADRLSEIERAAQTREGWQTIETAPKDATRIIGLDLSRDGRGRVCLCWWQPEFEAWISGARVMVMADGYLIDGKSQKLHSPDIETPTHWIRFPAPPSRP